MQSSARTEQFSQPHVFSLLFQYTCFLEAKYIPVSCSTAKEGYLERGTGAAQKLMFTKHCRKRVFALHHEKLDGATSDDSPPSETPHVREPGLARPLDAHAPEALPLCQHKLHGHKTRVPKNRTRSPMSTGTVIPRGCLGFAFVFWGLLPS